MLRAMVSIRRATIEDREQIARVHEASIRARGPSCYAPEQVESWAAHITPERYTMTRANFFVATEDGQVVGFGQYHEGEVEAVYVAPSHIGKGVGRLLMEELLRIAAEEGVERVFVVSSLNAVPFYASFGFELGEKTTWRSRGGLDLPCMRMELPLMSS
jgi:predicted N-acetyltransferase YhbS